jgi:hypothetical protein
MTVYYFFSIIAVIEIQNDELLNGFGDEGNSSPPFVQVLIHSD